MKSIALAAEAAYETSDPTVDSQIVRLKSSGADLFYNISTPKFAAQAIRKIAELGWKPIHILAYVSSSVGGVLKPAGFEASQGVISLISSKTRTIRCGTTIQA